MAIRITKKIKGYSVAKPEDAAREAAAARPAAAVPAAEPESNIVHMHEKLERPDVLIGSTYKIKSPLVEHAMYVTINDIVLNQGSEHELRRPFEVFINSKNMDHFQWIVALTRIMSAVFRKGGDVTFLVDEMKAVFDPRGGYFKQGGVYMPSIVAEIGSVVEEHLKSIGMIHDPEMDAAQRALIAEKRAAYEKRTAAPAAPAAPGADESVQVTGEGATFPPSATMCFKCSTKATVIMDGCATCLNCGYSKCG
ncbi:NrdJb [Arenimonas composti]|uniref:ribonucleoside-diphosphate reductase n=1 Tax=Arenimonas composti TR7-09 = DSM 18010 TaxID=1121013 RepID=A0A091BEH3_9GAMM|nr:NrdJb [Arenimonas composti]KFN50136.1 NrdJb [Arenimonas composti TR7-09 = DSM 18010]